MQDLVIIGAGGHGRETLDVVEAIEAEGRRFNVLGFVDDDPARAGTQLRGHPVLGDTSWLLADARRAVRYVAGIGSSRAKARIVARLDAAGLQAAVLVHPDARLARGAELGPGVVITAGVLFGCDVRIGAHTYVNLGASVSHDAVVGDHCHLAPGVRLAGAVRVGAGCELGIGAVVTPGVSIGEWSIVGAGAAVVRDVPPHVVVAGVPARVLRSCQPVG